MNQRDDCESRTDPVDVTVFWPLFMGSWVHPLTDAASAADLRLVYVVTVVHSPSGGTNGSSNAQAVMVSWASRRSERVTPKCLSGPPSRRSTVHPP